MTDYDAIVIGSGAGGLTSALALARAGKRVGVLEQHYLPGGWCHSFTLEGYRFSPGVHYIGELQPGGRLRAVYEGLGVGADLEFVELNPDGYDHVLVGGERFDIPRGREAFARRLAERFPREAKGARAYLDTCQRVSDELGALMNLSSWRDLLLLPLRSRAVARWGLRSAQALIRAHAKDPMLRAILGAQSGDHGLPPARASAAVHAAVAAHYFEGGWYPRGGGHALPRAFVRALRRAGGEIRLRTSVERILVEGGRAIGVRLADGTELRAGVVVSNADPHVTFGKLLAPEEAPRAARRLKRTRYSVSCLSLFLATDLDLEALGLDSGNYWRYAHPDLDAIYEAGLTAGGTEFDEPPGLFVTATTLKDPRKQRAHPGRHTLEAFVFVAHDAFKSWAATRYGERPESYAHLKRDLEARMLRGVARVVPGIVEHVLFSSLGTPLTNVHYVAATAGNLYGTEKSVFQVGPWGFPVRTEVKGLYLCGASTLGHGVMGATFSGLFAAGAALHARPRELLRTGEPPLRLADAGEEPFMTPPAHAVAGEQRAGA